MLLLIKQHHQGRVHNDGLIHLDAVNIIYVTSNDRSTRTLVRYANYPVPIIGPTDYLLYRLADVMHSNGSQVGGAEVRDARLGYLVDQQMIWDMEGHISGAYFPRNRFL